MDTKVTKGKSLAVIRSDLRRRKLFNRLQGHKVFFAFADPGLILLCFYPFILDILRKVCSYYFLGSSIKCNFEGSQKREAEVA